MSGEREMGDPPGTGPSLRLELDRDISAPAIARSAVAQQLGECGIDGAFGQTVVLLVSEVVSNAVRHSSAPPGAGISLDATVTENGVRIAVTDAGAGFTPRPRDPDRLGEGYGLYLVAKAASAWGIDTDDGTTVWFELER
ncbi:MAG TPA: ATP-binding protein [Solirubrobacteraceae bacterium]|nr:ATP-binding protein [Solirubrobacteraceae bacterium]